jgi:hypothetical protein
MVVANTKAPVRGTELAILAIASPLFSYAAEHDAVGFAGSSAPCRPVAVGLSVVDNQLIESLVRRQLLQSGGATPSVRELANHLGFRLATSEQDVCLAYCGKHLFGNSLGLAHSVGLLRDHPFKKISNVARIGIICPSLLPAA